MITFAKIRPILKKALSFNLQPTEDSFPELPTVLIWFRFILAVAYGSYVGFNLLASGVVLIQALNLLAFVPTIYCKFFLGVPSDVFATQVVFSGLPNAMALVVLIWVYCFTSAHEREELQLTSLLISAVAPNVEGEVVGELEPEVVISPVAEAEEF